MNIKEELLRVYPDTTLCLNDIDINPEDIRAILVNEVSAEREADDFYGNHDAYYLSTTIPLFQNAGIHVESIFDILDKGIYITNALKQPKSDQMIDRQQIATSLPILEKELSLFPNVKVIMLMGDVAKKAFNMISKKRDGKYAVPSISTYKIRNTELYYHEIRILPSYIMTGKNLLIEKSKFTMASEDIARMYDLIRE